MVTIDYNNYDNIFSGLGPTPTIQKTEEYINYNARWGVAENLTFNGFITGSCLTFAEMVGKKNELVMRFNKDFRFLRIYEDSDLVYKTSHVAVENISFPESNGVGLIPYSIELKCYPENLFSGFFGVLDPKEEINFSEREDGTVEISHSVSARGFNTSITSTNALSNAINFVQGRTGWRVALSPYFISHVGTITPVLTTVKETEDRFNGIYSIEESYTSDKTTDAAGILRYKITHESGVQGAAQVTIDGEINGGLNQSFASIQSRFTSLNLYTLAASSYADLYSVSSAGLNSSPLSRNITQNTLNNTIGFSYAYDNDPTADIFAPYTVSFEQDSLTFNVIANINGVVKARGDRATRWTKVQNHYNDRIKGKLFTLVNAEYEDLKLTALSADYPYPLNPHPVSEGQVYNQFDAIIEFSASFKTDLTMDKMEYFRYQVNFKPALRAYSEVPLLRISEYYLQDLEYNRRTIMIINGEGKYENDENIGLDLVQIVDALVNSYAGRNYIIDSQNFTKGNGDMSRHFTFNVQVSYDDSAFSV